MDIRELRLLTSDLAMQRDFYIQRLSLSAPIATPDRLTLQLDAHPFYHFAFNIPPQQFAEAKAWIARWVPLITNRIGADEFYFEAWNAHALYFYDPAGNLVELIARHTLASQPHQPFTAQSLLHVSEIGLVTDSVPDTDAAYPHSGLKLVETKAFGSGATTAMNSPWAKAAFFILSAWCAQFFPTRYLRSKEQVSYE
jgi:catechol 2,3-dioxygenase-like lactoylglutathione lyase family enzyme